MQDEKESSEEVEEQLPEVEPTAQEAEVEEVVSDEVEETVVSEEKKSKKKKSSQQQLKLDLEDTDNE